MTGILGRHMRENSFAIHPSNELTPVATLTCETDLARWGSCTTSHTHAHAALPESFLGGGGGPGTSSR